MKFTEETSIIQSIAELSNIGLSLHKISNLLNISEEDIDQGRVLLPE